MKCLGKFISVLSILPLNVVFSCKNIDRSTFLNRFQVHGIKEFTEQCLCVDYGRAKAPLLKKLYSHLSFYLGSTTYDVIMWKPSLACYKVALFLLFAISLYRLFPFLNKPLLHKERDNRVIFIREDDDNTTSVSCNVHNRLRQEEENGDDHFQQETVANNTKSSTTIFNCKTSIAIGVAITTRKLPKPRLPNLMPFFHSLLPSFCKTASEGYDYQFFLAYDYNDGCISKCSFRSNLTVTFTNFIKKKCPTSSAYSLRFVKCGYTGKPAWAQNDAIIEAYLSGVEYFYRINDDTIMKTGHWTERFIDTLNKFNPPRIGVVGPKHEGGNLNILTYEFTHRTHVDIHGFYYPRVFTDWYADHWITFTYKPGRSIKLADVHLVHTMERGQRYRNTRKRKQQINDKVEKDKTNVIR